jgi:hypothetical protein
LRTTARITAFRPGQSPPPVNMPILIVCSDVKIPNEISWDAPQAQAGFNGSRKRGISSRREETDYH